jgi:hypothetical protein
MVAWLSSKSVASNDHQFTSDHNNIVHKDNRQHDDIIGGREHSTHVGWWRPLFRLELPKPTLESGELGRGTIWVYIHKKETMANFARRHSSVGQSAKVRGRRRIWTCISSWPLNSNRWFRSPRNLVARNPIVVLYMFLHTPLPYPTYSYHLKDDERYGDDVRFVRTFPGVLGMHVSSCLNVARST